MIITFIGHSDVCDRENVYEKIKSIITEYINQNDDFSFYCGGYGDFDDICVKVCRYLKEEGLNCKIVYVTPYISESQQKKIKYLLDSKLYDSVLYPPLETVPYRFAISKRNEWMINEADLIVAYVKYSYGGAYETLEYAKRKKKHIINIAE